MTPTSSHVTALRVSPSVSPEEGTEKVAETVELSTKPRVIEGEYISYHEVWFVYHEGIYHKDFLLSRETFYLGNFFKEMHYFNLQKKVYSIGMVNKTPCES